MSIRAIIFDMDGVLIDARDWHYESLNQALGLFGYTISRYEHVVAYDGLPTRQKLKMLTAECGLPPGLHSFINEMKQQFTEEQIHSKCRPQFQHEFALSKLRAEGFRLAVASNSIRRTMELMLNKANLVSYIEFYLSNESVTESKPSPEIYNLAIDKLGLSPEECLVIEDNENGIQAAEASGAHVLVVRSPSDVHYEQIMARVHLIAGESK